jgi:hypothetical protein
MESDRQRAESGGDSRLFMGEGIRNIDLDLANMIPMKLTEYMFPIKTYTLTVSRAAYRTRCGKSCQR